MPARYPPARCKPARYTSVRYIPLSYAPVCYIPICYTHTCYTPHPPYIFTPACYTAAHYTTARLHRPLQANVEQIFSRAGLLSDPNLDPTFLAILVKVAFNKNAYKPPVSAIKDKYYEMFRGKGNLEDEIEESAPAAAAAVAAAAAGPSSSGSASWAALLTE